MPLLEAAILYAVWNDFRRAIDPALLLGVAALQRYLESQPVGEPIVRSPAFFAISERTDTTFTLVARGQFSLFQNVFTGAVFDLQLICDRNLAIINPALPPLIVQQWRVASGQLTIGKRDVWHATVGIVRTEDRQEDGTSIVSWGGRGRLELEQLQFMADALLITDGEGVVLSFSFELPQGVMIPLGSTALGINGLSGLLAVAFKPRMLDDSGVEVVRPDARDYVRWALEARQNSGLSLWQPARSLPQSFTIGSGLHIGTIYDGGGTLKGRNIGFIVITPEDVFLIGGTAILIDSPSLVLHFAMGYDVESASLALGGVSHLEYPDEDPVLVIDGPAEGFFSFHHPELFYLNVGTREAPIQASLGGGYATPQKATAYFQIDAHRITFGARIALAWGFTLASGLLEAATQVDVSFEALLGWDPGQVEAIVIVGAEIRLRALWLLRLVLRATASVLARYPHPARFEVVLEIRLEDVIFFPPLRARAIWSPIPDDRLPPVLASPLLCGTSNTGGVTSLIPGGIAALLPPSRRTWVVMPDVRNLNQTAQSIWPDALIVVAFAQQVVDSTGLGVILGPPPSTQFSGGYQVRHELTSLLISHSSIPPAPVAGVTAVWAESPAGTTSRLLILGDDPFLGAPAFTRVAPRERDGTMFVQDFGIGDTEGVAIREFRTFSDLGIEFIAGGEVWAGLLPSPGTRVLRAAHLRLTWLHQGSSADHIILIVVGETNRSPARDFHIDGLSGVAGDPPLTPTLNVTAGVPLEGGLQLWLIGVEFRRPVSELRMLAIGNRRYFLLQRVVWREVRRPTPAQSRVLLSPGSYTLSLEGMTTAEPPEDRYPLPAAVSVRWSVTSHVEVVEPDELADYVVEWTVGNGRPPNGRETAPWNPTNLDEGFPWYHSYLIVLRSRVPWLLDLWPGASLELRIVGDTWESAWTTLLPQSLPTSEQLHDARGRAWIEANGGTVPYDLALYTQSPKCYGVGAIRIEVRRVREGDAPLPLHTLRAVRSQFPNFAAHITPARSVVDTGYTPSRRFDVPPSELAWERNRDPFITTADGHPPPWWRLSTPVQDCLGPVDATATRRFARLSHLGGAAFLPSSQPIDFEMYARVTRTRVEALLDMEGRVVALWWRTPEPLDWRRVEASVRIRHPFGSFYAPDFRAPLAVVPSPDGSSAFLVATPGGSGFLMPRGTARVTLTYHLHGEGVVSLALPLLIEETVTLALDLAFGWVIERRMP